MAEAFAGGAFTAAGGGSVGGLSFGRRVDVRTHACEIHEDSLQLRSHELDRAMLVVANDAAVDDEHDRADHGAARAHRAQQYRGASITEIVGENRRRLGIGKRLDGLEHRIVLVRTHGALAQPEHVPVFVVQRNGMGARRLDRGTHFLANRIEIDERTFHCAEGLALLHRP